jgi:hypothetical protein
MKATRKHEEGNQSTTESKQRQREKRGYRHGPGQTRRGTNWKSLLSRTDGPDQSAVKENKRSNAAPIWGRKLRCSFGDSASRREKTRKEKKWQSQASTNEIGIRENKSRINPSGKLEQDRIQQTRNCQEILKHFTWWKGLFVSSVSPEMAEMEMLATCWLRENHTERVGARNRHE